MRITPTTKEAYELFHEGSIALAEAEFNGIEINQAYLQRTIKNLDRQSDLLKSQLMESEIGKLWKSRFGNKLNFQSDSQLRKILFVDLGLEPARETKGGKHGNKKEASVSATDLEAYNMPDISLLMKYKNALKMSNTYLKNIEQESQYDGYVHPFFHLAGYDEDLEGGARSYRGSSSKINFQNQPNRHESDRKLIRRAFKARLDRRLMGWDYGGVEVCLSVCNHQDPNMLRYVEHGDDMHRDCASMCFMLPSDVCTKKYGEHGKAVRQTGKNGFVFPQFYFQEPKNTARNLWGQMLDIPLRVPNDPEKLLQDHLKDKNIRNYDAFEEHIQKVCKEFWEGMFPGYYAWRNDRVSSYEKKGYFDMLTGFRIEGVMSKYQLGNYPIQGPAFHCLLWAFIQVYKEFTRNNWGSLLIGQIHDELLADVPYEETKKAHKFVEKVMTVDIRKEWDWIIVPMTAEGSMTPVNGSWYEKADFKDSDLEEGEFA